MDLPSHDFLTDVFTFLSLLHSDDIAPRQRRFLSPTTINRLNSLFLVPEKIHFVPRHRKGGKRGLTERETERICFIHFLCEATHLVALTGRFLKPTLRAAHWLARSDFERTQILFETAFLNHNRRLDDLWCAYRLPGYKLVSPHLAITPLFDILSQIQRDQTIHFSTLLKMIPLAVLADDPEHQPATILCDLVRYLQWFGAIQQTRASIRLTDLGVALLDRRDASTPPRDPKSQPLRLNRRFDLIAPLAADLPTLYELANYTELLAVKPQRVYRLNRERIHRALARGATFASLVHLLEKSINDALPRTLVETLQIWAQEIERVTIRRVTILETRDRATLEQLTRVHAIRERLNRTLSPRVVTLRESDLPMLLRQLPRNGYPPRVELPQLSSHPTNKQFDDPTLTHLYLAASIGHHLPELIPAHYRVPYSIVMELEKQLSERDLTMAMELLEELTNDRQRATIPVGATLRGRLPRGRPSAINSVPSSSVLQTIERAIDASAPLHITYYAASHDETTTRVVEPLRIEWRGRVPYLIAYCRLRQDERVFRVERITQIRKVGVRHVFG